ncbi:TPA: trans-2-enoyl-CoA reductase family protein [Raoultella planticola]|nr:trans-2-enoyl-CoA reductase family protein [Raoultella planticola]
MIIKPQIKGVVSRTAHPYGCRESVHRQINYVKQSPQVENGPKKVLVLGASSGFGLATRISAAFGGSRADTIGVSFERGPSEKGVGSAGWYNNIFFREAAEKECLIAKNFVGDAFSCEIRRQVVDFIRNEFGGKIDLIVYSLATGVRPDPETGKVWHSSLKTIGDPLSGPTINLELDSMEDMILESASEEEIEATVKVMGGEDWESWIDYLNQSDVLAPGCKTVAYSYIGSEKTYRIYHEGTLGIAKAHLHKTGLEINKKLASTIGGEAYVVVCKALVTKASVFIPAFSPYILALFKVMKARGVHEGCIEQMQRLLVERLYPSSGETQVDEQGLIRIDDLELRDDIQSEVIELMEKINTDNFKEVGDYEGYRVDFLQLNGFGFDNINYDAEIKLDELLFLKP